MARDSDLRCAAAGNFEEVLSGAVSSSWPEAERERPLSSSVILSVNRGQFLFFQPLSSTKKNARALHWGEKSACIFFENFLISKEFRYSKSVSVKRAKQISHLNSPRISDAIEDRKFVNGEWGGGRDGCESVRRSCHVGHHLDSC
jgi:hypothetical protein